MKILLLSLLAMLTACVGVPTYNAKAYKNSPVIFENDKGLAVLEADQTITPYVYYVDQKPTQAEIQDWYVYNFRTQVIDEKEAKALNVLGVALAADIVTSQLGFSRGCVEKNVLAKGMGPAGMAAYSLGNWALYGIAAKSSTIYQSTLKHDTRKIYAGAAFKGALAVKNLATKC